MAFHACRNVLSSFVEFIGGYFRKFLTGEKEKQPDHKGHKEEKTDYALHNKFYHYTITLVFSAEAF